MLLLARSILLPLADFQRMSWSHSLKASDLKSSAADLSSSSSIGIDGELQAAKLMSARAAVAHQRLLQGDEPSATLWDEVQNMYAACVAMYCEPCLEENSGDERNKSSDNVLASRVMLGWGLFVAVLTFVAMIPWFLGLLIVLPLLGHASWHLYRQITMAGAEQNDKAA